MSFITKAFNSARRLVFIESDDSSSAKEDENGRSVVSGEWSAQLFHCSTAFVEITTSVMIQKKETKRKSGNKKTTTMFQRHAAQ